MKMTRISTSLAFLILSLSLLSCGSPGQQDQGLPSSAKVTVDTTARLVSLDVQNAPLGALLAELGQHAQITVSIPDEMKSERLTLAFQHLPLEGALKRVLAGQSYTLLYRQERGLDVVSGVRLFAQHRQTPMTDVASSGIQALALAQASQGLPTLPPTTSSWGRMGAMIGEATPVTISDDLLLDELKRSLTEAQDPALRSATLEAIADRGDEGPVTPILAQALSDTDEEVRDTVLNLLKSSFDPVPIGPLASMATLDNNPESRMDALSLMTDQLFMEDRTKEDWATVTASLNHALSDPDPDVRDQAAMLLPDLSQAAQPTSKWGVHR